MIYDDHQGGYIDNVPSTFTRSNNDLGNAYFNIKPTAGRCPNGLPAGSTGFCALPNAPVGNNTSTAANNFNPVDRSGARISALYKIDEDWDFLVSESLQDLNAQGLSVEYPVGSDFQPLKPYQVTAFTPSYNKDNTENTAWTLNGKIYDLSVVYTGGFTVRNVSEQMDYANYTRTGRAARHLLHLLGQRHPGRRCGALHLLFATDLLERQDSQHPFQQRISRFIAGGLALALHRRCL